jgi:hypothetical protein
VRKAGLLKIVCLSHAEDVAIRATRCIPNDYDATLEKSEADYSHFTVFFALVWNLRGDALESYCSIFFQGHMSMPCSKPVDLSGAR